MSSSVIPSTKYSWLGSLERFCMGSTATERIEVGPGSPNSRCFHPAPTTRTTKAMTASPPTSPVIQPRRAAERGTGVPHPFALAAATGRGSTSDPHLAPPTTGDAARPPEEPEEEEPEEEECVSRPLPPLWPLPFPGRVASNFRTSATTRQPRRGTG